MNAPKPQKRCRLECNADGHPNTAEPEFGGEDDRYASWATCVDCGALVPFGAYDASCNAADQLESPDLDDCECPDCRSNAFWSPPQTWPKTIKLPWRDEGERRRRWLRWAAARLAEFRAQFGIKHVRWTKADSACARAFWHFDLAMGEALDSVSEFLCSQIRLGLLTDGVSNSATSLLADLLELAPVAPIPTIGAGPDGLLGMTWENNSRYLNIEVFPDDHVEVFGENLVTRAMWSEDFRGSTPPPELAERLRLELLAIAGGT